MSYFAGNQRRSLRQRQRIMAVLAEPVDLVESIDRPRGDIISKETMNNTIKFYKLAYQKSHQPMLAHRYIKIVDTMMELLADTKNTSKKGLYLLAADVDVYCHYWQTLYSGDLGDDVIEEARFLFFPLVWDVWNLSNEEASTYCGIDNKNAPVTSEERTRQIHGAILYTNERLRARLDMCYR